MADAFASKLSRYAELVVKKALNVQRDQVVLITAPVTSHEFVGLVTKHALEAGAKDVVVDYTDENVERHRYALVPDGTLDSFYPQWKMDMILNYFKEDCAYLRVYNPNPDLLNGIDPSRVARAVKARNLISQEFSRYITQGRISWTMASVPSVAWAAKLFPDLDPQSQVDKLWDLIFQVTRIHDDDPIQAWEAHIEQLTKVERYLNDKRYAKLHYRGPGTDLTIELADRHRWICAQFATPNGVKFLPNVPTEEVFTAPKRDGVNGTISSTKPLNYNGSVIDQFRLTFKDGRVVDFEAKVGYEALKNMLATDENAAFLGEVALVPHDSPISNSDVIFYNTLYDENASCHLALGRVIALSIEGGADMTNEQLLDNGGNHSLIHVDFMVGSGELDIDAITKDGKTEPLFRNGNWAFEL